MDEEVTEDPERPRATEEAGFEDRPSRWRPTVANWLVGLVVIFFLGPLVLSNLGGYLQSRLYLTEAAYRNISKVAALEASETLEFVRASQMLLPSIIAGTKSERTSIESSADRILRHR